MVDYDLQKTFTVSERLRKRDAKHIMSVYGKDISVKISIGVAELAGGSESFESIMDRADQAIYLAKRLSRNQAENSSLNPVPQ
jgi:diguanylate cyclase (GGDEF)-like protein